MKSLIPWLEPLGLVLLSLTAALVHSLSKRRWRKSAWLAIPWLLLVLTLCTPLPSYLVHTLERPWLGTRLDDLPEADVMVALGGAGENSALELVGFHFSRGTDRLMTAVELMRREKSRVLLCGGGGHRRSGKIVSEADAAKAWIDHWQLIKAPIFSLGVCSDTHDEAVKTAALCRDHGWTSVILVTSASHMHRARAVFEKTRLRITAAPCHWHSGISRGSDPPLLHSPHFGGAELFGVWFHEIIGWWVYRLRGWV